MRLQLNPLTAIVTLSILLTGSLLMAEGPGTSGGGGAMVCRDASGNVTRAELLDLWEASEINKNPIAKVPRGISDDELKELMINKLAQIDPLLAEVTRQELAIVLSRVEKLPSNISIQPPADALNTFYETGCKLEGAMYYLGKQNKLTIKPEIINAFSQTHRIAGYFHEAIYKVYRDRFTDKRDGQNSRISREVVGCLFGTKPFYQCKENWQSPQDVVSRFMTEHKEVYQCSSKSIDMIIDFNDARYVVTRFLSYQNQATKGSLGYYVLSVDNNGRNKFSDATCGGFGGEETVDRCDGNAYKLTSEIFAAKEVNHKIDFSSGFYLTDLRVNKTNYKNSNNLLATEEQLTCTKIK